MPTIVVQCSDNTHDCLLYTDFFGNLQFKLNFDYVATGYKSIGQKYQYSGLYFPNVPIPPGSTIQRAYLILRCYDTNELYDSFASIAIQDDPNPNPFSTLVDYLSRSWRAIIDTHIYHNEPWKKDVLYSSRDIANVIQQSIDNPLWHSGNSIVLQWGDEYGKAGSSGWDREAYAFDSNPSQAARLEITYEPPTPPPAPPPPPNLPIPPPPPRKGWVGLDLKYIYLPDGFKLIYYTDVPCHLYCRMTTTPPRRHSLPSMRRGLRMTGDIRFCFTVYEDNEQAEAGDTLIHTFIKPAWPVCETRWFYFIGFVYGDTSPSESSIFEFHFPNKPPKPPSSVFMSWDNANSWGESQDGTIIGISFWTYHNYVLTGFNLRTWTGDGPLNSPYLSIYRCPVDVPVPPSLGTATKPGWVTFGNISGPWVYWEMDDPLLLPAGYYYAVTLWPHTPAVGCWWRRRVFDAVYGFGHYVYTNNAGQNWYVLYDSALAFQALGYIY